MSLPLQVKIAFDGLDASEALCTHATEHAARLARFADIRLCEIVVSRVSGAHRNGNRFAISLRLHLRGSTIDIDTRGRDPRHEDAYAAVADAFDAARRRLEDQVRSLRDSRRSAARHQAGE